MLLLLKSQFTYILTNHRRTRKIKEKNIARRQRNLKSAPFARDLFCGRFLSSLTQRLIRHCNNEKSAPIGQKQGLKRFHVYMATRARAMNR